ncbi:hypothetical protein [Sphingomonas sp. CFBP 8760]|uniref:hypothetical protein n=1 Tax=Sphingomonas sp. CFBP 8760 TaxID=2775282 RepID=UPI0017821B73|nr:hypothetical protein [Sphingomonas sp. CFBP 8760]MBD8546064.1 hypothetical protein [Sphingomonas sp. CFBP 8760]
MNYLAKFTRIGWDVDDTLIGSRHAHEIADYIRANPLGQQHHIVTFRSHGMQGRVFRDLEAYGLDRRHFDSLTNCPDHVYEAQGEAYRGWKGSICAGIGIEVLVDDDTENVASGCAAHGVEHIHPDHLFIDSEFAARVRAAADAPPVQSFSSIAEVHAWLDSL